jgi:hypothetical protein
MTARNGAILAPAPLQGRGGERGLEPGCREVHEGAGAFLKDLSHAELHLLDSGHFALEDKGTEIDRLMRAFLDRAVKR